MMALAWSLRPSRRVGLASCPRAPDGPQTLLPRRGTAPPRTKSGFSYLQSCEITFCVVSPPPWDLGQKPRIEPSRISDAPSPACFPSGVRGTCWWSGQNGGVAREGAILELSH